MLWHIGNTTVRTPYRLQGALRALLASSLNGNLIGHAQEQKFAELLHTSGVVEASRIEREEDVSDLGRKWRVALSQLGFITPHRFEETIDRTSYAVTQNGYRLADADNIAAQQECFLRSIVAYQIPSSIEKRYQCNAFSPLRFVLNIIFELAARNEDALLKFDEFSLYVQTRSPDDGIQDTVTQILSYRRERASRQGGVHPFDRMQYDAVAMEVGRRAGTLRDYADLSFRYLKATGLFQSAGRGICLSSRKMQLAHRFREEADVVIPDEEYLQTLWMGAGLPTDDAATSLQIVTSLAEQLTAHGVSANAPPVGTSVVEIENLRHVFEERLSQLDEEEFANAQTDKVQEIAAWMDAIASGRSVTLADGTQTGCLGNERPAYLEWVVWRAFLAMNSLIRPAWECRNFKIDQDFLPIHCAPGGQPDMVFEFEDMIVVVEVTLTSSSRQEAAEGEPVRRHVAKYAQAQAQNGNKRVYGLFIALQIDSNTAHTFRSGTWYLPDDSSIALNIVPLTLSDFKMFLLNNVRHLSRTPDKLRILLLECRAIANHEAPQWKHEISRVVRDMT